MNMGGRIWVRLSGLLKAAMILGWASLGVPAHGIDISSLDTGAGFFSTNNGDPGSIAPQDPNWTVTLLSGGPPPGGNPNGQNAYVVPNSIPGFVNGDPSQGTLIIPEWANNDATSSWITYSTPTQLGLDNTDEDFLYELEFTADSTGVLGVNFLSDNVAVLSVNGTEVGTNAGLFTEAQWLSQPISVSVVLGSTYTIALEVNNAPNGNSANPTGARVEFTGDVNATPDDGEYIAVPDISRTGIFLVLGIAITALLPRRSLLIAGDSHTQTTESGMIALRGESRDPVRSYGRLPMAFMEKATF